MKKLWPMFLLILGLLCVQSAEAVPNPLTCEGYPEPRVFISSQAWYQTPSMDTAHVHQEACLPERRTMAADFTLDVRLVMHDNPGTYSNLDLVTKGVGYEDTIPDRFTTPHYSCPLGTCERWVQVPVRMSDFRESGLQEVRLRTFVNDFPDDPATSVDESACGKCMHASTNFQLYVENGRPQANVTRFPFLRNKGLWNDPGSAPDDFGYCEAGFTDPLPMVPTTGTWNPRVRLVTHSSDASFPVTQHTVTLDPDFHAGQPGTVIKQGVSGYEGPVSIDTRTLSNGVHKLHLRSDCESGDAVNSGIGVIHFVVANGCPTDFDGSGFTDSADIALILARFNTTDSQYDLNGSGYVDTADIALVTNEFGRAC